MPRKKLKLSRESVRTLNSTALHEARGALQDTYSCRNCSAACSARCSNTTCPSKCQPSVCASCDDTDCCLLPFPG